MNTHMDTHMNTHTHAPFMHLYEHTHMDMGAAHGHEQVVPLCKDDLVAVPRELAGAPDLMLVSKVPT